MAGEGCSSRPSKLPLKRPFEYPESEPLDPVDVYIGNLRRELDLEEKPLDPLDVSGYLDTTEFEVPDPKQVPVEEGPPQRKHKKSKKQIDKDHRLKKKAKFKKLENDHEKMKLEKAKMEGLMEQSKEQNAGLLAELEFYKLELAKLEKNLAQIKCSERMRKQVMTRLHKLIEKDVSVGKKELLAQLYNPNGKQIIEKYWEENEKSKDEFRTILKLLLDLPHEEY